MTRCVCTALVVVFVFPLLNHAEDSRSLTVVRDVEYARAGEHVLKLDLHLPRGKARSPLIVWIHGGAWRSGSRSNMP